MSPKRGDRVTVPPPDDEWDIRFGTSDAVKGWEELCRHALGNTRRCFEALRAAPGAVWQHLRDREPPENDQSAFGERNRARAVRGGRSWISSPTVWRRGRRGCRG